MPRLRAERLWAYLPHSQQHRLLYHAFQSKDNLRIQNFIHKNTQSESLSAHYLGDITSEFQFAAQEMIHLTQKWQGL